MAERLKNTLSFVDLAAGASITIAHGLNTGNTGPRPLAPDIIFIPNPDLDVTSSDAFNVTLHNGGANLLSGSVLVEAWHTLERAFNGAQNTDLPVKPYVVVSVENNGAPPSPPFPVPQVVTTIYARMTGDDTSGKGTLAKPYRTVQRAVLDVPLIPPRGTRWIIDDSGVGGVLFTEVFPDNYMFPAWVCAETVDRDPSEPYFAYQCTVAIRATPQLVSTLSVADATVNASDILSVVANPRSGLLTITLNAPRLSWGGDALRGKFAIGNFANSLEHCVIGKSTDTTIEIAEIDLPTMPIRIMEPSAHLSGDNTEQLRGALNVANCGSIEFSGQRIVSNSGAYGLYTTGCGFQVVQLCELEGPNCELGNTSGVFGRLLRTWTKIFCYVTGNFFYRSGLFDQCFFYSPIADVPAIPEFSNLIFDGCDPVEVVRDDEGILVPAATPRFRMDSVLVRNGTGDGVKFHGVCGSLTDVDIYNCPGNGLTADEGAGVLNLFNVGTTGPTNGGVGVRVDDGLRVKVDPASSLPFVTGTGDSFAFVAAAPPVYGVVTLNDAAAPFTAAMVGQPIKIEGATSPGNNGVFTVASFIDASNITYNNGAGVAEAFAGTWTTGLSLTGAVPGTDDMKVGFLPVRSWANFTTVAPIGNEYDLVGMNAGATAADSTGSRLSKQ